MITQQARYLTRNRLFVRRDYGTRTDFGKALLKKFVFQIHPDYFENHKEMKRINATNLSILQNIMEGTSINDLGDGFRDTRSLVFYVKSVPEGMTPKRVKVSLNHLEKSVIEILETIGIDIPQMTEAVHHQTNKHYSGTVAATRKQTLDFLDSMNERKDLVTWREERTRTLRIKQEVELHNSKLVQNIC